MPPPRAIQPAVRPPGPPPAGEPAAAGPAQGNGGGLAGQGTGALEILDQVPEVEVLVASIGGGGWLGGMALAIKSLKPSVRVVGVESSHLPKMRAALDTGGPIAIPAATTLADGIAGKRAGARATPLLRQ